jgi:hypothetical protein
MYQDLLCQNLSCQNLSRQNLPSARRSAAVMPAAPIMVVAAAHCDAASFAELRRLCVHAGRDFGYIGNDVGAKPHRIGRAGLLLVRSALRNGAVKMTNNCTGQQCQPAERTNNSHNHFPSLRDLHSPRGDDVASSHKWPPKGGESAICRSDACREYQDTADFRCAGL